MKLRASWTWCMGLSAIFDELIALWVNDGVVLLNGDVKLKDQEPCGVVPRILKFACEAAGAVSYDSVAAIEYSEAYQ